MRKEDLWKKHEFCRNRVFLELNVPGVRLCSTANVFQNCFDDSVENATLFVIRAAALLRQLCQLGYPTGRWVLVQSCRYIHDICWF